MAANAGGDYLSAQRRCRCACTGYFKQCGGGHAFSAGDDVYTATPAESRQQWQSELRAYQRRS